jgi:hypothetical protein
LVTTKVIVELVAVNFGEVAPTGIDANGILESHGENGVRAG